MVVRSWLILLASQKNKSIINLSSISTGETHAIFHVKIYKDFEMKQMTSCIDVKFININYSDDTVPIFVVYSYNPVIENINYNEIADEVIEKMMSEEAAGGSVSVGGVQGQRRKRQVSTCQVNELIVGGEKILNRMVGSRAADFSVLFPEVYNAGICGGSCKTTLLPDKSDTNHAPFVYLLLEQPSFKEKFSYSFSRCCAPVRYGPLQVFSMSDGSSNINTIEDMRIEECECLDIINLGQ